MWVELYEGKRKVATVVVEHYMTAMQITHERFVKFADAVAVYARSSWDNSYAPGNGLEVAQMMEGEACAVTGRAGDVFREHFTREDGVVKVDAFITY